MAKTEDHDYDLSIRRIQLPGVKSFPPVANRVLPQHPFQLQMSAQPGSGKTNLLVNFITRPEFYKGYFHRIIIISPSIKTDDKWYYALRMPGILAENKAKDKLLNPERTKKGKRMGKVVYNSEETLRSQLDKVQKPKFDGRLREEDIYDEVFSMDLFRHIFQQLLDEVLEIEQILKDQGREEFNARYIADRVFIVMDDQSGSEAMSMVRKNNPLVQFASRHRHVSASAAYIAQEFKAYPPGVRNLCQQFVGFELSNEDEQYKVGLGDSFEQRVR